MEIRMYNTGFGECFQLRKEEQRLFVNFGSRNRKIGGKDADAVYDAIIREVEGTKADPPADIVFTQLYQEQVSGFLYLHRKTAEKKFGTVYLPDFFSEPQMKETLALLLLTDLTKGFYQPGKMVTLCGLLETLLKIPYKIRFLSRGGCLGGENSGIRVLSPDKGELCRETEQAVERIGIAHAFYEQDKRIWRELLSVSGKLRELFMRTAALNEVRENMPGHCEEGEIPVELAEELKAFRREFQQLRRSPLFCGMTERFMENSEELKGFRDRISLVFHTAGNETKRLLFAGDIPPDKMRWLEENRDGREALCACYSYIKLPNHGADGCYYDFSGYRPEHFLISNGSLKGQDTSRISGRYAGVFAVPGVKMHCTNCDCCEGGNEGLCSCWEAEITAPGLYSQIK